MVKYVGYIRVSTEEQGKSGLSLKYQEDLLKDFCKNNGHELFAIYSEVGSGGDLDRVNLKLAIEHCKEIDAILLVKSLDRLTRAGAGHLDGIRADVKVTEVDNPGATEFVQDIGAVVSKEARKRISKNTKNSISKIKKTLKKDKKYVTKAGKVITSLGNVETLGGEKAIKNSVATRQKRAAEDPNNIRAQAVIKMMRLNSYTFKEIVDFLNTNHFKTSRGNSFSITQARNLYNR